MVAKKDSFKERLGRVRERVARRVRDTATKVLEQVPTTSLAETKHRDEMETLTGEPPVVARLMIEIRSDGLHTIARGALKDELSGEQVSLEAKGTTPIQLAAQLAKGLLTTPLAAGQLARAMMTARRGKPEE